MHGKRGYDA